MFVLNQNPNEQSLLRRRLAPGAPGLYESPPADGKAILPSRMDVCGIVGVAPRGPVRVPKLDEAWQFDRPCVEPARPRRRSVAVPVDSFEDYSRLFGGFEGPGRLPYAVSSFFAQGGQRAWIVRIVHEYGTDENNAAVASGLLTGVTARSANGTLLVGGPKLKVRSEGAWANSLRTGLGYSVTPVSFRKPSFTKLELLDPSTVPVGSLLRLTLPGGLSVLRFVATKSRERTDTESDPVTLAVLDQPLVALPDEAELIEGSLLITDGRTEERHVRLGLSFGHSRWLANVLCYESEMLWPENDWAEGSLLPESATDLPASPELPDPDSAQFSGGEDRFVDITHSDFFDAAWDFRQPEPGDGVHALIHQREVATVVVPDLYVPEPLPDSSQVADILPNAGPEFVTCLPPLTPAQESTGPVADLPLLDLNPNNAADFETIVGLQSRLVEIADRTQAFVVLLDVPPDIGHRQVLKWRTRFQSSCVAAYHPWVQVAFSDSRGLFSLNPSAVAAGIIAAREIQSGVPTGPANVLARNVVNVTESISPAQHDGLHPIGINVFLRERDGIRLTAARTLSTNPHYRQLSVRRLMMMLRRVLERQTQWMVFEPNTPSLWADVRHMLTTWLRQLFEQGAFRGSTPDEAFFVKCDADLNTPQQIDAGRLHCEVGVAPAEPIEFIVLKLTAGADGTEIREVAA